MKRTARRKTTRRRSSLPVLLLAALMVFAAGIAVSGGGTPDRDQTTQENLSAQIPAPSVSMPPLSTPPSIQEPDEPIQSERHEPTKKVVQDGFLVKKRVLNSNYELYDGLHEPIVTQEQWDAVKAMQRSRQHFSVNTTKPLMNPFAAAWEYPGRRTI